MKLPLRTLAASLVLALAASPVMASGVTSHLLVKRDDVHVRFNAAGGSTVERIEIVKAMDAVGARMLARLTIPYNASREHVAIHGASVVFPDKDMRLIPNDAITTKAWPGTEGSPSYQDAKRLEVEFGEMPVGSQVAVQYSISADQPWLAGDPGFFAMASRADALQEVSYTITAPASLHLDIHANALTGGQTGRGAMDTWSYHAAKLPPLFDVASRSELMSKSPYVVVAGAPPAAAAGDYLGRIAGAEHVSLELQHLADVLGKGTILPATLMARDYAWIDAHVRLVRVPLALAGAPRRAEDILLDRYGSAEDRVILLQALLKAKSVPSDVVLLPTLPATWAGLPMAIPSFNNRLMLTVDGGRLPLDIGSPVVGLGSFDASDRGKFGLRVAPHGGTLPLQVPPTTDGTSAATVATNVIVQASGALDGAATVTSYGELAAVARGRALELDPLSLRHAVAPYAPGATQLGVTHLDDPHVDANRFVLVGHYSIPGYHPLLGTYRMPVPRVITGFSPMDDFARQDGAGLCQRTARAETTAIHWAMPAIVDAPKDVVMRLAGGLGQYRATYVYDEATRTLHVQRSLRLGANPIECDSQQQRALAKLAEKVRADLAASIEVTQLTPTVAKR